MSHTQAEEGSVVGGIWLANIDGDIDRAQGALSFGGGGSIPGSSRMHSKCPLGKILNPQLPLTVYECLQDIVLHFTVHEVYECVCDLYCKEL